MNNRERYELTKWLMAIIGLATIAWMLIYKTIKAALNTP